jgi:hypothetical protein
VREPPRTYLDTSIFGGAFDEDFSRPTEVFLELVRGGEFLPITSALVAAEIGDAPDQVKALFQEIALLAETVEPLEESLRLGQHYIDAGVVSPRWRGDALHVATATVARCSLIVSWNFLHIVNYRRIPRYNAVNALRGYGTIAIHSPLEVISGEDAEED